MKPGINIVCFKIVIILVTIYTLKSLLWTKFGFDLDKSVLNEAAGDEYDG
jgi:hypothetical protein